MTILLEATRNILDWFLSDAGISSLQSSEVSAADQHELGYHVRQARTHILNAITTIKKY